MRSSSSAWDLFWAALGYLRRNRRQRRAATKRRDVRRAHRYDTLEQRVVLNADPVAVDDDYTVNVAYGFSGAIDVSGLQPNLGNDSDPDGESFSMIVNGNPGSINVGGGGTYSYGYTIADAGGAQSSAVVRINVVENPNSTPTLNPPSSTLTVAEGASGTISASMLGAIDPENSADQLTYTITGGPNAGNLFRYGTPLATGGTFTQSDIDNGYITYTHDGGEATSDSFSFTLSDLPGAAVSGTFAIAVTPVNDSPTLQNGTISHSIDGIIPWTFDPMSMVGASDPEGDILTAVPYAASSGTLINQYNGTYTFQPTSVGAHSFLIAVTDYQGAQTNATVYVTVTYNTPPLVNPDDYSITIAAGTMTAVDWTLYQPKLENDFDTDPLTIVWSGNPGGTQMLGPGSYGYDYTVDDGHGNQSIGRVTLTINADSPPQANQDTYGVTVPYGGGLVDWNVYQPDLANDTDAEGGVSLVGNSNPGTTVQLTAGSYTYGYVVQDSFGNQTSSSVTLNVVEAENLPAVVADLNVATDEDTPLMITHQSILTGAVDPEGYAVSTPFVAALPQHGSVVESAGSFIYTPAPNHFGADSFVLQLTDSGGAVSQATVWITVNAVNDAPQIGSPVWIADQNETLSGPNANLLGGVVDADQDMLTIDAGTFTTSHGGTATVYADGSFTYTPAADFVGTDAFSITARDSQGGATSGLATIVVAANVAPIAHDDSLFAAWNTPLNFSQATLLENDFGGDDDLLEVVALRGHAQHGDVAWHADGSFTYTPHAGFIGVDKFQYDVADETDEARATVWIEVGPLVTTLAGATTLTMAEDSSLDLKVTRDRVGGSPVTTFRFASDQGTFRLNGSVISATTNVSYTEANSTGLTFTPNSNYNGNAVVLVTAGSLNIDGSFQQAAQQTATIEVTPVNDAPWANNVTHNISVPHSDSLSNWVPEPTSDLYGSLFGDIDGDSLTIDFAPTMVGGITSNTLYYTVTDAAGASASGSITLNVSYLPNHDPSGGNASVTVSEDSSVSFTPTAGDADGDSLTYSYPALTANGVILSTGWDGSLTYTPSPNFSGTDSFQYSVTDGFGGSATFTVVITVTSVNDPLELMVPGILSLDEGATVSITSSILQVIDADTSSNDIVYTLTGGPSFGTIRLDGEPLYGNQFRQSEVDAGRISYKHDGSETTSDSFSFSVSDGNSTIYQTLQISIAPVNEAPTLTQLNPLSVGFGGAGTIGSGLLQANDPESDATPIAYTVVAGPSGGTLHYGSATGEPIAAFTQADLDAGMIVYVNGGNGAVNDGFTFTMTDGSGTVSGTKTFTINVSPPIDNPPSFTIAEDIVSAPLGVGEVELTDFITAISQGAGDEQTQTLTFSTSTDNPELFAPGGEPTITIDPTTNTAKLKFTAQYLGSAEVTVKLSDGTHEVEKTFVVDVGQLLYGSGNGGGSGYGYAAVNWEPDLSANYGVSIEPPSELEVRVTEAVSFADDEAITIGGDLPSDTQVRVMLRVERGLIGTDESDPNKSNIRYFAGTVAAVNAKIATWKYMAGDTIGSDNLLIRVTGPALDSGTRPSALKSVPITVTALPEIEAPTTIDTTPEERIISYSVTLKYIDPAQQGTLTIAWGDGTTEAVELKTLDLRKSGTIGLRHLYKDAGEFTITATYEETDRELVATSTISVADQVPVIVLGDGPEYKTLRGLVKPEPVPSGEGATGIISGRIDDLPDLGLDGDRTKYEVEITVGGTLITGDKFQIDDQFRFAGSYRFDNDRNVGQSDQLDIVVRLKFDGQTIAETTLPSEVTLINKAPTLTVKVDKPTVQQAYEPGFDLLAWALANHTHVTATDPNPGDSASGTCQSIRYYDWSIPGGEEGDLIVELIGTDGDDAAISVEVLVTKASLIPERYRTTTTTTAGDIRFPYDPENPTEDPIASERSGTRPIVVRGGTLVMPEWRLDEEVSKWRYNEFVPHLKVDGTASVPRPADHEVDIVDGKPVHEINVLQGRAPLVVNFYKSGSSYLTAGTMTTTITDLFDNSLVSAVTIPWDVYVENDAAVWDNAPIRYEYRVTTPPGTETLSSSTFTFEDNGKVKYEQTPQVIDGLTIYQEETRHYEVWAIASPSIFNDGELGETTRLLFDGSIHFKGGTLGYEVTSKALDAEMGESLQIGDAEVANYAIVRFSREYIGSISDPLLTDTADETTVRFRIDSAGDDDDRLNGDAADIEFVTEGVERIGDSNVYTVKIEDGKSYVDVKIKGKKDSKVEFDQSIKVVVESAMGTQLTSQGANVTYRASGTETLTIFDSDSVVAYGSTNIDTESTGLTREVVVDGSTTTDLFDGRRSWSSPIGSDYLPVYQFGYAQDRYVTYYTIPSGDELDIAPPNDGSSPERDIRIALASKAVVAQVTSDAVNHGTLRGTTLGVADAGGLVELHNPNPTAGSGFFGYVDQLVPVFSNGPVPLQGFILARRDGTTAFFYGKLGAAKETKTAVLADGPELPGIKQWTTEFTDLAANRYYTIKDAVTDKTLGLFRSDANGKLKIQQGYEVDNFGKPSAIHDYEKLAIYEFEEFIAPDGTFGTLEATGGVSEAPGGEGEPGDTDEDDAVRFKLKIDGGKTYEFDESGYLTREMDRSGNRTEYDYDHLRASGPVVGSRDEVGQVVFRQVDRARLTEVTLQGNLQIRINYGNGLYNEVSSIVDPFGRTTVIEGDRLISVDPGAGDQSQQMEVRIGSNITSDDGLPAPETIPGNINYFLQTANLVTEQETPRKAPTGKVGHEEQGTAEADHEASASYQLERLNGEKISVWKYQFDRFGLLIAKSAPKTDEIDIESVWKWERNATTGLVEKAYAPSGRGADDGFTPASGDYDIIEYQYFENSADLKFIKYADGTKDEWTYDPTTHNVMTYKNRNGDVTTYHLYEGDDDEDHTKGDVEYVEDALGKRTYFTYTKKAAGIVDLMGGLIKSTRDGESGRIVQTEYYGLDASDEQPEEGEPQPPTDPHAAAKIGLVKKVTYAESQADLDANTAGKVSVEQSEYDAYGHLVKFTNTLGVVTVYRYDKLDQLLEERVGGEITSDGTLDQAKGVLLGKYVYDDAGNLRSKILPNAAGNAEFVTTFEYDSRNRLIKMIEPKAAGQYDVNPTTEYAYTADDLIRETKSADGLTTTMTYDQRRQAVKTAVAGNSLGLVKRNTTSTPFTTTESSAAYDVAGNLKSTTDALGRTTDYAYDFNGRLVRTRTPDPDGTGFEQDLVRLETKFEYDAVGNLTKTITPNPNIDDSANPTVAEIRIYDAAGNLLRVQQPKVKQPNGADLAKYVAYEYDDSSLKSERSGVTTASPTSVSDLNADGTASSDNAFLLVSYDYDRLGRTRITTTEDLTNESAPTTTVSVDYTIEGTGTDAHLVERHTDALQNVTTITYNPLGQVVHIQMPAPGSSDADGNALPAPVIKRTYNAAGQLQTETQSYVGGDSDPKNIVTTYTYDESGRVRTSLKGTIPTTLTYDMMDRLKETRGPDGSGATTIYNNRGNTIHTETHDSRGNSYDNGTDYTYDELGRLYSVRTFDGDVTYYQYDALDRIAKEIQPDTSFADDDAPNQTGDKIKEYQYDRAGNLAAIIGPAGQRTAYKTFDALGRSRWTLEEASAGFPTIDTNYDFDDNARTIRIENEARDVTTVEYDGLGRVVREGINIGDQTSDSSVQFRTYQYDAVGNLKTYTDRDRRVTDYTYDNLNRRVSEISKDPSGAFSNKNEYSYDKYGNLNSVRAFTYTGNPTTPWPKISDYKYENYDIRGRVQKITETLSVFGVSQTIVLEMTYQDRSSNDPSIPGSSGYTVTAKRGNDELYTNTYRFDYTGSEVLASQNAPETANDKEIRGGAIAADGSTPSVSDGAIYANRTEEWTRYKGLGADRIAVSNTVTFFEAKDTQLVRRIEHRDQGGQPIRASNGRFLAHAYNYDALDRPRRYVDRTHDGESQELFEPSSENIVANDAPYSRITETKSNRAELIRYDLEGHVTSFEGAVGNYNPVTLTWIAGGRLIRVEESVLLNELVTSTVTEFAYDSLGRLIAKMTSDGKVETYFYDHGQETLRFLTNNGSTALTARSLYSSDGDLIAIDMPAPSGPMVTYWTLNDAEGTVRDLMTNDWTLKPVDYDEKGFPLATTMESVPTAAIRYHGNVYVPELDGYYDHGRWISAILEGRSLSPKSTIGSDLYSAQDPNGFSQLDGYQQFELKAYQFAVEAGKQWDQAEGIDKFQIGLGIAGFLPGWWGPGFDVVNGLIYAARDKDEEAAFSFLSAVPGAGDAFAASSKAAKLASAAAKVSMAVRTRTIGTKFGQVAWAVGTNVAGDLADQSARIHFGKQEGYRWEQTFGAAISAGALGHLTVGVGRQLNASASFLKRTAAIGAGSGAAALLGDGVSQAGAIYSGRQQGWDPFQSALSFAGGALGGALGQSAFDKTCFSGDTPLIVPNGPGWKNAEEIRVDDLLASRDEHEPDGEVRWKRVEEVFVTQAELWELCWNGRKIRTTPEHPFFVEGRGWTPARELTTGSLLATMEGRYLPVESIASTGRRETVYNFRIADSHTYFVGKPEWEQRLWAHNACVYQSVDPKTGVVLYVGIADRGATPTFRQRSRAAGARTGFDGDKVFGTDGMTRKQVEAIEQTLIAHLGRTIDGSGTLVNKYRGVHLSPSMIAYGKTLLKRINYPGF